MIFSPHFDGEGSSSHPLNTRPTSSTSRFAYKGPFLERLLPLFFLFFSFLLSSYPYTNTHTLTFSTRHLLLTTSLPIRLTQHFSLLFIHTHILHPVLSAPLLVSYSSSFVHTPSYSQPFLHRAPIWHLNKQAPSFFFLYLFLLATLLPLSTLHLPPSTRAFKNALPVSLEFEPEISPNHPLLRLVSVHSPNVVNSFYSNPSSSPPLSTIPTFTVSLDNILFCPLLYSVSALSFLSRPLT
ncbi:hypothetical protein BKA57DRAFT_11488 [Linnemannia elongata]|nr:hypothetical protein BKA57DRAFT_11488 [Linnemannia elongata]